MRVFVIVRLGKSGRGSNDTQKSNDKANKGRVYTP